MDKPLITIAITAFNAQDTIEHAVRCALAQDWSNAEILICDDASTDQTAEILNRLRAETPSITILTHEKNKGVAAARNTLANNANGEFVAFFDDDDISTSDRLSKQYEALLKANNQNALCHSARKQSYPDGAERTEMVPGTDHSQDLPGGENMAARILFGQPLPNGAGSMATCSQFARRQTYLDLGGFDESFTRSEDTDLAVRHALSGGVFIGLSDPLVRQTMTPGSDKKINTEHDMMRKLLAKHSSFIEQHTNYDFCMRWTDTKFMYLRGDKVGFNTSMVKLFFTHPLLTLQRLIWALPNLRLNKQQREFHQEISP